MLEGHITSVEFDDPEAPAYAGDALKASLRPDGPAALAVEMMKILGRELTAEQSEVITRLMALNDEGTGQWRHDQFRLTGMPAHRTAVLYARVLAGLILFDEQILWLTDGRHDAKQHLERLAAVVAPLAGMRVSRLNGAYGVNTQTHGWLRILPADFSGYSADLVILDSHRTGVSLDRVWLATLSSRSPQLIFDTSGVLLD